MAPATKYTSRLTTAKRPNPIAPLAVIGGAVALYHLLLQLGIIPESAAPCRVGVPCSEAQVEVFGFVSIPMLSLLAFAIVTGLLSLLRRRQSQ